MKAKEFPFSWSIILVAAYMYCAVFDVYLLPGILSIVIFGIACGFSYRRSLIQRFGGEFKHFLLDESRCKSVLLVTAHPDDESMFFSPFALRLKELGIRVRLLCVSAGDFYGAGRVRRKELINACQVLGIPKENVIVWEDR